MNVIVFKVKGNKLTRVGGRDPVSGEKNQTKLRFVFDDEDWQGITSATVTQFFDVRNGRNIPFENDQGFGGSIEVSIHEELRGLSGILWVGLTGYNPKTGATLDCVLTAVPVSQGTVVTEIIGTKLYQEILEFYLSTKANVEGAIAGLEDKFGKEYWKRIVTVGSITTYEELFDTVGLVNSKGSIAQVAVDITTGTEGTVKGICLAYGKGFATGDTVYLINTSTGDFWKIDRYITENDGVETVSFRPSRLRVTEDQLEDGAVKTDKIGKGAVTPEKLDRGYWEKYFSPDLITDWYVLFELAKSKTGINLVNLKLYAQEYSTYIEGFCEVVCVGFVNAYTLYITNITDGSHWKMNVFNEGSEAVPVYRCKYVRADEIKDGSIFPEKLARPYWERYGTIYIVDDAHFASMLQKEYIGVAYLSDNVSISYKVGKGPFLIIPVDDTLGMFSLFSFNNGKVWTIDKNELKSNCFYSGKLFREDDTDNLTCEQVDALDKMFEMAAYKDEAVAEVYKGFVSAFGLDKFRAMRTIESGELIEGKPTYYWNPAEAAGHNWKQAGASLDADGNPLADGVAYTYQNIDGSTDRTCYPYFDIPAEGRYDYQVYFKANDGVKVAIDFYNQNVLDAVGKSENWNATEYATGFGWQDSMGFIWQPPMEINGSPTKAMRLYFNRINAGVVKIIIYRRKRVTEDADS